VTPRRLRALLAALGIFAGAAALCAADFPLVRAGRSASLVVAPGDAKVVQIAAQDLARDIATVTGVTPSVLGAVAPNRPPPAAPRVLIGTLGRAPEIDALVASGALAIGDLRGAWESFLIATLAPPAVPAPTLVIVGSDRRGTAFGVYELSQQIGVSPWHWWADATPERKSELLIADGTRRFGPPSVKYRGIFLNDEDWGLQPWAATTFEPENGGIGPKTYARVFELLLRLKANTLWPAMHACTKPFNADPRNAALADDYAIVMGSSHAEPMLRNNVGEWPHDRAADYNYVTNRAGVRAYWEERVRTNGRYENLWTIGMRGVHDSAIQGAKTDAERIAVLEQVFADQRALLAAHCRAGSPDPAANTPTLSAPQIFCAYKEVLDLYRGGLRVPDDVTIVWPDDNFGYVRNFASPEERRRSGGFGVYYHLSYLGRPLAYLWLCTTPPALIWEEMTKSYAHGADRVWIANVGDLKPAEIGTEFFLRLAWDVKQWGPDAQPRFLREFAAREFGTAHAGEIAAVLGEFYRLNFVRKPEHLQWWLPGQSPQPSDLAPTDIERRLAAFAELRMRAQKIAAALPSAKRDAFFELVAYPVQGAGLANQRYFLGERSQIDAARAADAELREITRVFNEEVAAGKWRGFLRLEPADTQWKSMRIAAWTPPAFPHPAASPGSSTPIELEPKPLRGTPVSPRVAGLGRTGHARALLSGTELRFEFGGRAQDERIELALDVLPTHPLRNGTLRFTVLLDDQPLRTVDAAVPDGGPVWAQGVLAGTRSISLPLPKLVGRMYSLRLVPIDDGIVIDRVTLRFVP